MKSEALPKTVTIVSCPIRLFYSQVTDRTKTSYHRCFENCGECFYNR